MRSTDLRRRLELYIAEGKAVITIKTTDLAAILSEREQPYDALARLVAAARAVANLGSIDSDAYVTSKDTGLELRAALHAYDRARNPFVLLPGSDEA
jgi:hypothetical protein